MNNYGDNIFLETDFLSILTHFFHNNPQSPSKINNIQTNDDR